MKVWLRFLLLFFMLLPLSAYSQKLQKNVVMYRDPVTGVDTLMMLITHYLIKKEEECEVAAISRGHDYNKREIHTAIESAKSIPVGCFIPREFSTAYLD